MPYSPPASVNYYPAYCFPFSPTYDVWVKLTAAGTHNLKEHPGFEGQNIYFHLNHPIRWIRLVGVIVAIDVYPTRWILLLDDSSGVTLEVTCGRPSTPHNNQEADQFRDTSKTSSINELSSHGLTATGRSIDLTGVDIGTVVKVKGGIGSFRGEKQLLLERISILGTTNEEIVAWAENVAFQNDILHQPWTISKKDEEQARRKAEGLDRRCKSKEKKRNGRDEHRAPKSQFVKAVRPAVICQKNTRTEASHHVVADANKLDTRRIHRAEDQRLRKQEFERLRAQRSKPNHVDDDALETQPRCIQSRPAVIEVGGIKNVNKQEASRKVRMDRRKEQAITRRAEERRFRELEFQRLQRSKNTKEAAPSAEVR